MSTEQVAQQFADARPGFVLASYGEVGLPLWRIRVWTVILARKPVGPLEEFVLRGIRTGLTHQPQLQALLGLDEAVVETTLVGLVDNGHLRIRGQDGAASALELTESGAELMTTLAEVTPEEKTIYVNFDGLLREPVGYIGDWLEPRDLRDLGVREIPPSPARGPDVEELRAQLGPIERAIAQTLDRHEGLEDVLTIKGIDRRFRVYKPATVLVYRARHGPEVEIAFAIEGELSERHEAAFARAGLARKLGIGKEGLRPVVREAESILSSEVLQQLDEEQAEDLRARAKQATEEGATDVAQATEAQLASLPVRTVPTYEHPQYLAEALQESTERVLIISPWIRNRVVNHQFLQQVEEALDRGTTIFIGWGMGAADETNRDADKQALARLGRLGSKYPGLCVKRLGQTHAKVLVADRRFVIVTSFNWLSFRGDPKRTFRDERGILVSMPAYVEEQFQTFSALFD